MSPSRRQAPAAMEQAVSTDALREALELKIDELLDEFVAELDRKTFEDYAQKRNTYSSRIAALAAPASETACPACAEAARHANSDATTPGFFYDKCEMH